MRDGPGSARRAGPGPVVPAHVPPPGASPHGVQRHVVFPRRHAGIWTCVPDAPSARTRPMRSLDVRSGRAFRTPGHDTHLPAKARPRHRQPHPWADIHDASATTTNVSPCRTAASLPHPHRRPTPAGGRIPRRPSTPPADPQQNRPDTVRLAFHPRRRRGTTIAGSPARARRRGGRDAAPGPPAGHRRRRPRGLRAPVAPGRPHRSTTGKNVTGLPLSAPRAHKYGALSRTRQIAIRRTPDLSPTDDVTIARRSLSRQSPVRRRRAGTRCDQQVDPLHERRTHLW